MACKLLTQRGFCCAMTLIFTVAQAVAAMNAGAAYVFPFVGRTDQYSGGDGLQMVADVTAIAQRRNVYVVAASIKSLYQLEMLAKMGVDYAAIPIGTLSAVLVPPADLAGGRGILQKGLGSDAESKDPVMRIEFHIKKSVGMKHANTFLLVNSKNVLDSGCDVLDAYAIDDLQGVLDMDNAKRFQLAPSTHRPIPPALRL